SGTFGNSEVDVMADFFELLVKGQRAQLGGFVHRITDFDGLCAFRYALQQFIVNGTMRKYSTSCDTGLARGSEDAGNNTHRRVGHICITEYNVRAFAAEF